MARVPRILPPGTLRRLRLKWFALGVLLGTATCAALAMYLAAIMPPELAYRSAEPTRHPAASPTPQVAGSRSRSQTPRAPPSTSSTPKSHQAGRPPRTDLKHHRRKPSGT